MKSSLGFLVALVVQSSCSLFAAQSSTRPNIVLIITDDQGYGDLACHGNPVIKTPHLDKLYSESTVLTDYHVAPTCSPTRAALLTGHWTNRTGVWHTIMGRSMIRDNEVTLGQHFAPHYATAMFGKWHLGDNYPYRPEDRGFEEVYRHGGGGVGQTPDVWDNSYFDGGYFHNGQIEAAEGFCTDVFFEKAHTFIKAQADKKEPFLAYIATNAPHGPLHCPQKYLDLYQDQSPAIAAFFGMISNIDDNIGRTRQLLADLGIADNTLFIFTTDNGTASGEKIFNAGMRGKKGSEYDGGHRVPFFIHWPAAGLNQHRKIDKLTHAIDVVPTLMEVCSIPNEAGVEFDGASQAFILDPDSPGVTANDTRMIITDSQRVVDPIKWRKSAVMSSRYRLVNGSELYDIKADPGQKKDLAKEKPEQVAKMRAFYDQWWAELEPTFSQTTEIHLGHPDHPKVTITAHDWLNTAPPWHQGSIRAARGGSKPKFSGHWAIKVLKEGHYRISLLRWPEEARHPINAPLAPGTEVPGASKAFRTTPGISLQATEAALVINGRTIATQAVDQKASAISFTTTLPAGSHQLAPVFLTPKGQTGAFYCIVETLP